jgi:hypothetical protein
MTEEAEKARPQALRIDVVEGPSAADNQVILDGLRAFNAAQIGRDATPVPLSVFVRDDSGAVQGEVFGVLEGYPPGSRRYYLRKTLVP